MWLSRRACLQEPFCVCWVLWLLPLVGGHRWGAAYLRSLLALFASRPLQCGRQVQAKIRNPALLSIWGAEGMLPCPLTSPLVALRTRQLLGRAKDARGSTLPTLRSAVLLIYAESDRRGA